MRLRRWEGPLFEAPAAGVDETRRRPLRTPERLRDDPSRSEFSAQHYVGEAFLLRDPRPEARVIEDEIRLARTPAEIARISVQISRT